MAQPSEPVIEPIPTLAETSCASAMTPAMGPPVASVTRRIRTCAAGDIVAFAVTVPATTVSVSLRESK